MFILLAVTFTLGVFVGVLIVGLLIVAKENQKDQDGAEVLSENDRDSLYLLSHPAGSPERFNQARPSARLVNNSRTWPAPASPPSQ